MKSDKLKTTPAPEPLAPADVDPVALPDNAFRELAADEQYRPVMHPARAYREVTPYSVGMGLLLASGVQCRGGISRSPCGAGV